MEIIITEHQQQLIREPTRLDVLREMNKRHALEHHEILKNEWLRLEKGWAGEKILLEYLENYGQEHWKVLKNVWLNYYGEFECDLILFTQAGLYHFEVKNYTGHFEFKDNQCQYNGRAQGGNPISQTQKATTNLRIILKELPHPPSLQGALTFVGVDNQVLIHDELTNIDIVSRNELREYIWKIVQQERNYRGYPMNIHAILEKLNTYEKNNSFVPEALPGKAAHHIKKGICCSRCGNFDLKFQNSYIVCSCGVHESREEAIVRTICEYGVIYNKKNLTTTELTDFFGGDISYSTVYRYLNKHFERIGASSNTAYLNKRLPYDLIHEEFQMNLPKYLVF